MKFPSFSQWKQIFKVLKKKEKIAFVAFSLITTASLLFLVGQIYLSNTVVSPAVGGTYIEGVVGQPRFINPIYGEANDIDRGIIDLVFSGLMTYDKEGKLITDLAETYQISGDGKTYDFTLKNEVMWHDGKSLTADDIIFTIQTIQNPEYKSPLRANWLNVDVKKTADNAVRFTLKAPYLAFLENCTVKIIPKHIFESISPENVLFSYYNLDIVGSGPYTLANISKNNNGFITAIDLDANRKYYSRPAFISQFSFRFFEKKEDLVSAANLRKVDGFSLASLDNDQASAEKQVKNKLFNTQKFHVYSFALPRYVAVFFNNQKSSLFADVNIRKAFTFGTDKETLINDINKETKNGITSVDSPILPDFFNYQPPVITYDYNLGQANSLLEKAGFVLPENATERSKPIVKKPAFQFTGYLKIGSKSSEVTQLQQCLSRLDDNFKNLLSSETEGTFGKGTDSAVTAFQQKYLPDLKPTGETGASTRQKLNTLCFDSGNSLQPLTFTLTTINQPQLVLVANKLRDAWQKLGATVTINAVSMADLKTAIKSRNYDALLYGEALGGQPDLYPFWHSSQKLDPGLNLSSYENKTIDQLLKSSRETTDEKIRELKYEELQNIIIQEAPALFLYNPDYIYWVSGSVKGIETDLPAGRQGKIIDPAKRFANIEDWYIKTRRTWK